MLAETIPHLKTLARRWSRSHLDADDLVQDVLEKQLRSPAPANANARAWHSRVLHNLAVDKLRRRRARREDLVAEPVTVIEMEAMK